MLISQLPLDQIQKVMSVLKSVCSQLFKTVLNFGQLGAENIWGWRHQGSFSSIQVFASFFLVTSYNHSSGLSNSIWYLVLLYVIFSKQMTQFWNISASTWPNIKSKDTVYVINWQTGSHYSRIAMRLKRIMSGALDVKSVTENCFYIFCFLAITTSNLCQIQKVRFWNLLFLRISKLTLLLIFGQVEAEKIEVKDTKGHILYSHEYVRN